VWIVDSKLLTSLASRFDHVPLGLRVIKKKKQKKKKKMKEEKKKKKVSIWLAIC